MHDKNKYRYIPWNRYNLEKYRDINFWSYRPALKNQIKSLLFSHHRSTSALVSEILMSVLQTVQKNPQKQQFTYGQYIFTHCTEDNVQNTHTYTQYTQCTIKTYLVIITHYTPYVHIYIMYTSMHSNMWGATDYKFAADGCATGMVCCIMVTNAYYSF